MKGCKGKGSMNVKKKLLAVMLSGTMLTMTLSGCGSSQATEETGTAQESADEEAGESASGQEGKLESGKVELTVWAEENNFEMLEGMIESFKQKYAGQAEFEIALDVQSDAETKNRLLGDIHNGADVFSLPDDQLLGMIAAGALSPVPNADEVGSANLADAVEAASYNGTLFAYPYTADNGYFLYYT